MAKIPLRFIPGAVAAALIMAGTTPVNAGLAQVEAGWVESGQASWYGGWHNGHRTSSGAIFDQNAMTAAHASLPLGSRVRVTMERTGASVVVTVTDRQPDHGFRIIDLSRGAASRIGLLASGTGLVRLSPAESDEIEVAETPADDEDLLATPRLRDRRHKHRGGQAVWADRQCCHAPSVVLVRHSAPRRAIRRML